jgi:hypothetical protein
MFVTVVAVVCHLFATNVALCKEVIVTDSDQTANLSLTDCALFGQISVAKWKTEHPVYNSDKYIVARYKCVPGHYVLRDEA